MNHQDGIPSQIPSPPITSKKMSDIVKDSWVAKFCDDFTKDLYVNEKDNKLQYETYTKEQKDKICGTRTEFYDVITASNYMEITDLLHILSAKVATMIKQTPVEKMKGIVTGTHEIEVVSENKENKEITTVVPYGEISVEPVGIKNCNGLLIELLSEFNDVDDVDDVLNKESDWLVSDETISNASPTLILLLICCCIPEYNNMYIFCAKLVKSTVFNSADLIR